MASFNGSIKCQNLRKQDGSLFNKPPICLTGETNGNSSGRTKKSIPRSAVHGKRGL